MFGKPANPYDDIINKATDEKQTEMNWELALTVWDKVNEEGETGARNSVNSLTRRLNHRSANVQLFSLTLAGALVNNCSSSLHKEISGKAFTQALTRLINDRTTHESVKKEALKSIEEWVKEHPNNSDFDLLNDTYESLKRQNHKFPSMIVRNSPPPRINDEALRKEEEDLQRALAESAALSNPLRHNSASGYQPSSSSSPGALAGKSLPTEPRSLEQQSKPSKVRAMYDFVGQTPEELEFRRGEVIRVVECLYEDWWKGENSRGRIGIFPRNHVEVLPEEEEDSRYGGEGPQHTQQAPSEEELEGEVFAQVAIVDRLLALMQRLREQGQDFADNDELTDLYNSSMRLRPRVVKLIRKYDQKQADLERMNHKVDQARTIYEGMMSQQRIQQAPHTAPSQNAPHGYSQAQNGFHHAQAHIDPRRNFVPASTTASLPQSAAQLSQQQQYTRAPVELDSALEEQQRREYEQKWAEYERQMEEYNRQLAAHQQFYQQTPGGDPHLAAQANAYEQRPNPVASPAPSLAQSQTSATHQPTQPPPLTQPQIQPQPVWDGQAWVWPTQIAQALPPSISQAQAHHQAPAAPSAQQYYSQQHPQSPGHSPALATSAAPVPRLQSQTVSPPPNAVMYSTPPPPAAPLGGTMGNLTEGIAEMGLNGGHVTAPAEGAPSSLVVQNGGYHHPGGVTGGGGEDPAQAQWAGR